MFKNTNMNVCKSCQSLGKIAASKFLKMSSLAFVVLIGANFVLLPCEGNIFLPDEGNLFNVLSGEDVLIRWKIDSKIPISDLKFRVWQSQNKIMAEIIGDGNVTITKDIPFPGAMIEVMKPSTLVLKNVDKRFNGLYNFRIRVGDEFKPYTTGDVEVSVKKIPIISVNCSRVITLNTSDYFTCECKGIDGDPAANVTWYKENKPLVTGKEKQILRIPDVDKDDSGMYTCKAKSHEIAKNETTIELTVYYAPENVILKFNKKGIKSGTITCEADGLPSPTFAVFFKNSLVDRGKMYTICEMNNSYFGNYTCVAMNMLGNRSSLSKYLFHEENLAKTPTLKPSGGNQWYIVVVALTSGVMTGILLSYIVFCSRRKFRSKKSQSTREPQKTDVDTTYQELDLSKINSEDNYQSLRANAASNEGGNDDDSTYTELSKTRDVENSYQFLS